MPYGAERERDSKPHVRRWLKVRLPRVDRVLGHAHFPRYILGLPSRIVGESPGSSHPIAGGDWEATRK